MEIRIISGDLNTVGSVIELPWTESNLGTGPVYQVDPKTRKPLKDLQRFRITSIDADGFKLEPIIRDTLSSTG